MVQSRGLAGLAVAVAALIKLTAGPAPSTQVGAPEDVPITLAVIGDYGGYNSGAARVGELVRGWQPDAVVTVGDNLYSTPPGVEGTDMFDLTVGQHYCDFLGGAAPGPNCPSGGGAANRFFAATGNHDYSDAGIEHYLDYFDLPGPGVERRHPSASERYYDAVIGPVHLFVIDTTPALEDEAYLEEQRTWLQSGLAASTTPWQIVAMHHPPFSSGSDGGPTPQFQWPYARWGADLVLTGHEHSYERLQREGTTFLVNGLGGASRYDFAPLPSGGSAARYNANEGAVRLRVNAQSIGIEMVTVDGEVVDQHVIERVRAPEIVVLQDGAQPGEAYFGTSDATLAEHDPDRPKGVLDYLTADGDDPTDSGQDLAAIINWDVGPVPPGSEVLAASMTFDVTNPAEEQRYEVFAVRERWDEATVTWRSPSDGAAWAQPGARPLDAAVGSVIAPQEGRTTVLLEPSAVELIQQWLDEGGPVPAGGFLITASENSDGIEVSSSEADDPSIRPALEVTYRPPEGPWVRPEARRFAVSPGDASNAALAASGGEGPYTWSAGPAGTPDGVTLGVDGTLSIDSPAPGGYEFDVVVTDSTGRSSGPTTIRLIDAPDELRTATPAGPSDDGLSGLADRFWPVALVGMAVLGAAVVQRRRAPEEAIERG